MRLVKYNVAYSFGHHLLKHLINFSSAIIMIVGCRKRTSSDVTTTAAICFAGVFITESIKAGPVLRIQGNPKVKIETDSTFYISGLVEEFSPLNYPVGVKNFHETLLYSGGNPNKGDSWKCMELYLGDNK